MKTTLATLLRTWDTATLRDAISQLTHDISEYDSERRTGGYKRPAERRIENYVDDMKIRLVAYKNELSFRFQQTIRCMGR